MFIHFLNTLRSGLRSKSFYSVFLIGIGLIGCAYLAATFSPRQPETIALDVGVSVLRLALFLLAILWCQELVVKEIDHMVVLIYLAYPIPRYRYLLGRFSGLALLLLFATFVLGVLLWLVIMLSSEMYTQGHQGDIGIPYWLTLSGMWVDALIVSSFTLVIASVSTSYILPVIAGIAFSVISHSIGAVAEYLALGADGRQDLVSTYSLPIHLAQWVIPDLQTLDWRTWPMYQIPIPFEQISFAILMAFFYGLLMLWLAAYTFTKREFD